MSGGGPPDMYIPGGGPPGKPGGGGPYMPGGGVFRDGNPAKPPLTPEPHAHRRGRVKPWGVWPLRAAIAADACGHGRVAQLSAVSTRSYIFIFRRRLLRWEEGECPRGQGPRGRMADSEVGSRNIFLVLRWLPAREGCERPKVSALHGRITQPSDEHSRITQLLENSTDSC